jgi:hypothetical protein
MDDEVLVGVAGSEDSELLVVGGGPNCLFVRDCCFWFQEVAWLSRRCIFTSAIIWSVLLVMRFLCFVLMFPNKLNSCSQEAELV